METPAKFYEDKSIALQKIVREFRICIAAKVQLYDGRSSKEGVDIEFQRGIAQQQSVKDSIEVKKKSRIIGEISQEV